MTTMAPGSSPAPPQPVDEPGSGDDEPGSARGWTWPGVAYAAALSLLILAIPALGYAGYWILLNEDTGQLEDIETDPEAPGFEALVTPTPTLLAMDTDASGQLAGVTLLSLTAEPEGGGAVLSFPVSLHLEVPLTTPPEKPLDEIYELLGTEGLDRRIETLIQTGTTETVVIPPDRWAALVAPIGTLVVDNPVAADIVRPDGSAGPSFPAGEIELTPDQVADFVQGREVADTDLRRTDRRNAFWTAWLEAVGSSDDPGVVPGETTAGLGRYVRTLAAGEHIVGTAPVDQVPIPGASVAESDLFLPDEGALATVLGQIVPFPSGVGRLRTRLIDGVGEGAELRLQAAADLVSAGAQITVIANGDDFDQRRTVVVYFRRADKEQAEALAEAMGTDRVERQEATTRNVDAVVVIGRDYAERTKAEEDVGGDAPTPTTIPVADGGGVILPGEPGGDPLG